MLPKYPAIEFRAALVTFVPDINQIHIERDHEDEPLIAEPAPYGEAARHAEQFSAAYMIHGSGEHLLNDVSETLNIKAQAAGKYFGSLVELLPPDVISDNKATKASRDKAMVRFGDIALASRTATIKERQAFTARVIEAGSQDLLYEIEATRAAEDKKTSLHAYDHAQIAFQDQKFSMPLDSAKTIVATRLIQHLKRANSSEIESWRAAQSVWSEMPLSERRLFTENPKQLYSDGHYHPLQDTIANVTGSLLVRMKLARRRSENFITISPLVRDVEISLHTMPLDESTKATIGHVFPPGTDKAKYDAFVERPLSLDETRHMDALLLKMQSAGGPKSHVDAIALLDVIMNPRYKREIARRFDNPTKEHVEQVLNGLHNIVKNVLGWSGYAAAHGQRTMGGGISRIRHGRATQVSGNLPTTTKWYIGLPGQAKH